MCTLVVFFRMWPELPLLVAANRDERYVRPAGPPKIWEHEILAPIDLEGGGTWIGVNRAGVFAGITNRTPSVKDPSLRSRGELVLEVLAAKSADEARTKIATREAAKENAFHLLIADREHAFAVVNDREVLSGRRLTPGVHVLTERSFDAAPTKREPLLLERVEALAKAGPPSDEALAELLSFHSPGETYEGICVHWDEKGYGTRSSTLIRIGAQGKLQSFLHAEGPPCKTPYEDFSPLLGA